MASDRRRWYKQMTDIFNLQPYLDESADLLLLDSSSASPFLCNDALPEVLFLDEPTSGVDPLTRREFWNHINGLVERGVTVMVTTHFMEEANFVIGSDLSTAVSSIKVGYTG